MKSASHSLLRRFLQFGAVVLLAASQPAAFAVDGSIDEGIDYQRIVPAQPTRVPDGKIEVVEVFWYGCPHCYDFEPHLNKWLADKPIDVAFRRIPGQLNPGWKVHAAAYYVAEELGVLDKIHSPLFDAMHENPRKYDTADALMEFFEQHGVTRDSFLAAYNSFAVRAKMRHAEQQVRRYGVTGVPSVIVAGKYRTSATMAGGSFESLLKVVNYLVDKERKARKQDKP